MAPIFRVTILYTVRGKRLRSTRESETANAASLTRAVRRDIFKRHPKADIYDVRIQRKVEKRRKRR
jgi:hypothetical protein